MRVRALGLAFLVDLKSTGKGLGLQGRGRRWSWALGILGGSWVVISRVISRVTIVIT